MPAALVMTPVALALGVLVLGGGGPPSAGPPAVPAAAVEAPSAPAAARFTWPLRPRPVVLRRFAVGPHPWSPGHRGVDLATAARAAVLAAADGRVTFAGAVAGVGVVVVDHGTLRTTYEPVSATVPKGAEVRAGQEVGTIGAATGHCGVTCLHWGALRGTVYVDPLLLPGLPGSAGPPVLLPLGAGS